MEILIIDTETTGFGKCRLIELAWKQNDSPVRELRCKPPIPIEPGATEVHGITDEMLAAREPFASHPLRAEFEAAVRTSVVVAHNAKFDIGVLEREGIPVPLFIDTVKIAQKLYRNLKSHKLQDLRERFQLEGGEAHSAAGDVATLAALFSQMRTDLEQTGIPEDQVIGTMVRACA